jgi:hypothetical protein
MLLQRSWSAGFNGIYFISSGVRMWEILKFEWFLSLKIQINYKKPGKFGWKYQLKTWSHFQVYHSIQLGLPFIFNSSKIGYIPCKTMPYVEFPYFAIASHLGQWHRPLYHMWKEDNICRNMRDGSDVLLGMCWGRCWKLGKLHGSSLGTWWEHIGSKGENEKVFQGPPQL